MKLPAYPLVTVDPFFSLWSTTDNLYDSDTVMWFGDKRRLSGTIKVDDKTYRFMGKGINSPLTQVSKEVTPYITYYVFSNNIIKLEARFYTPLLIKELNHLSSPVSYIEYIVTSTDNKEHNIEIKTSLGDDLCYNKTKKLVKSEVILSNSIEVAKMGLLKQEALDKCGDGISAEWGYYYISGGECGTGSGRNKIFTKNKAKIKDSIIFTNIVAYDDIYSIEYMGTKTKGLWNEYHKSILDCINYYQNNSENIYNKLLDQNNMISSDSEKFGSDYQKVLTAAARQILSAHKIIKDKKGQILYLSKECHSNGSINTVDVSYPSQPFFLLYNPDLVKGMMLGILDYAESKAWIYNCAPHDIGTYPHADGQTYSLKSEYWKDNIRRSLYDNISTIDKYKDNMPIEECGNMLTMSYAHYFVSNDDSLINKHFDTLKLWADYLVEKGIVLEKQLCTDDFAGHCEKNVNLAIKSIIGIACFGRICEALNKEDSYTKIAKANAKELVSLTDKNGYLSFALDKEDTWSLKYNMVWDILFDFNLFNKEIYKSECKKYTEQINKYGTPLDYRADFTKTDWEMWASCLDETDKLTKTFANVMVSYLADSKDGVPFTDWHETKKPERRGFAHRTVQGGLWMPVLKSKIMK